MSVGHAPGEPQWTPDMRKDETQVTEAEKKEAKRRIQGQVAEESPDDSAASGPDEVVAADGSTTGGVQVPPGPSMAASAATGGI